MQVWPADPAEETQHEAFQLCGPQLECQNKSALAGPEGVELAFDRQASGRRPTGSKVENVERKRKRKTRRRSVCVGLGLGLRLGFGNSRN